MMKILYPTEYTKVSPFTTRTASGFAMFFFTRLPSMP